MMEVVKSKLGGGEFSGNQWEFSDYVKVVFVYMWKPLHTSDKFDKKKNIIPSSMESFHNST